MSRIFKKINYPKLTLLFLTIILAFMLFRESRHLPFYNEILSSGYLGVFIAGIFFTYGFTAAPATAILLLLAAESNIFWAGMIAGIGALLGDVLIFKFIRLSFKDEIEKLSSEKILIYLKIKTPNAIKKYLIPVLAGFIIASPLPDEIGVSMLAFSSTISMSMFMVLSYLLNLIGIFIVMLIGSNM